MNDENETIDTEEHPFIRVDVLPNGPRFEFSNTLASFHMFAIAAQIGELARLKYMEELGKLPNPTQKEIAIARGIPQDFRRRN